MLNDRPLERGDRVLLDSGQMGTLIGVRAEKYLVAVVTFIEVRRPNFTYWPSQREIVECAGAIQELWTPTDERHHNQFPIQPVEVQAIDTEHAEARKNAKRSNG